MTVNFSDLVPPKPEGPSDFEIIDGASGMPRAKAVAKLRELGTERAFATSVARECQGDPYEFWGRITAERERRDYEEQRTDLLAVLRGSGPEALASLAPDGIFRIIRNRVLLDAVNRWDGESLLMLGPTGAGKTAAAAEIVRLAQRRNHEARRADRIVWMSGEALLLSQRRHPLGQGEPPEYGRAVEASLLVIDDPDWIRSRDADELFALVCAARERRSRPMIVTSESTLEEFSQRYRRSVVRRIIESSRDPDGKRTGRIIDCYEGQDGKG